MDNDKVKSDGNQQPIEQEHPKPIFESIPVEEAPKDQGAPQLQPEEVSSNLENMEDVMNAPPPELPPDQAFNYGGEESKTKYFIIGGAVLFFVVILFLILKVIFSRRPTVAQPVTLTYWGMWEDKNVMDPLIAAYKQKNPNVTINYELKEPQDYREKLIARSKIGTGPDIFRFHNTWLPEIQEVAAPLPNSIMSNSDFEKTFYPVHAKDLKIDNYYYGIPLEIDGLVLIYNNNLFKKAGISNPPTNWDQVLEVVQKLTIPGSDGKPITSGIAIGTASNVEHFSDIFGLMLLQNGGSLKDLKSQYAAEALQAYRKMAEDPTAYWNDQMPNSIAAFIQEKVAMIFVPSWQIPVIHTQNPDLAIKVVRVPRVPNAKPISIANYWVEGVSKVSKNQLEAWKFLKFLSEKENMMKLYELESKTRLFGEPYSRVDLADQLLKNEYLGPVIQQGDSYVSLPAIARTYDNGLNDRVVEYLRDAVNATVNGVSYQGALETAQKGIDQVFTQYKIK